MHASPLQSVVDHLRRLTDPNRSRELCDAELLERFRTQREESAFTLLVQRHGPLVLNVCRRILGDVHEAEDAFQATFLVLVRKADTIHQQQSLAGWLHRVALRLALKVRTQSARRQKCEREVVPPTMRDNSFDALAANELRAALDEEIERLPDKYRMPLVLCYLAEKTHEQAARELGWPKSSVTARLAKARELLQRRLIRRGFTAPAGLLAVLLTEATANAAIPATLTLSTARMAMQALMGQTLTATATVALADSFAKGAVLTKWIASLTLLATLGFAAAVGHHMASTGSPTKQPESPPKAQAAGEPRDVQTEPRKPRLDLQGDPLPDGVLARMGSGRLRQGETVRKLAYSPDGKSIVSGGGRWLNIWDATTGRLTRRFDTGTNWTLSFAFTSEGILIASAGLEKGILTLQTIDPADGKVHRRLTLPDRTTRANVSLSRDGKWLAYGHQNTVRLHETVSGREKLRLPFGIDIAFLPDGKTVSICDFSDIVRIHDIKTGECTNRLKREGDHIYRTAVSTDGRYMALIPYHDGQNPGEVSIWDLRTCKEHYRLKGAGGSVLSVCFSPDIKYVAVGCQHPELQLFDMKTGKEVRRFQTDAYFGSIAFSPDSQQVAAASGIGTIRLWETATGRVLPASADPFLDSVHELHFSSDGQRLLGHAGIHFCWNPNSGRELRRFPQVNDRYWPAALSPDESLLATSDDDGAIRLWNAKTGRAVRVLKGHDKWVWSILFSPNGNYLITGGQDGTIRMWDVTNGHEIHKLINPNRIMCMAISPNCRWLASASDPGPTHQIFSNLLCGARISSRKSVL